MHKVSPKTGEWTGEWWVNRGGRAYQNHCVSRPAALLAISLRHWAFIPTMGNVVAVGSGADAYRLRYFNPAHDTRVCPMQDGTSSESVIPFKTKLRLELIIFVITFLSPTSGPTCARRRVFL
jgi:hypothetical protein